MLKKRNINDIILKIAIFIFIFFLPYLIMEGTKQEEVQQKDHYDSILSHTMSDIKRIK